MSMMISKKLTIAALGIAAMVGAANRAEANITYDLVGVTLASSVTGGTPEGTLTGTFTTNDTHTLVVSSNITASASGSFPGFLYTTTTAPVDSQALPGSFRQTSTGLGLFQLQLVFAGAGLTATGGTILTTNSISFEHEAVAGNRYVTAGSVVAEAAVPEPSSIAMLGTAAVFGLGAWHRRRRRHTAV